jgi:hypothetical protein
MFIARRAPSSPSLRQERNVRGLHCRVDIPLLTERLNLREHVAINISSLRDEDRLNSM